MIKRNIPSCSPSLKNTRKQKMTDKKERIRLTQSVSGAG